MAKRLKFTFLLFSFFFLSLGIESCGSLQSSNNKYMFEKNPPFTLGETYFQKWMAGIEEGGSGMNIHIIFISINPEVEVQDIYFHHQILKTQNSLDNNNEYIAHLSTNSKKDIVMDIDPKKEAQNKPFEPFPFDLKENEAVVSYIFEGKKKYFKIPNLIEKEPLAYPQSNPNIQN